MAKMRQSRIRRSDASCGSQSGIEAAVADALLGLRTLDAEHVQEESRSQLR
jgi:hypothetical protein